MKKILYVITILALMIGISSVSYSVNAISKPNQVTSLSVTNKTEQGKGVIKVTYKKVKGAKGYLIKYSTNSKYKNAKYKRIKKVTTLAATIKNLKADKKYYVKVRAYKTSGDKYVYGKYSKTKTAYTYRVPEKTAITKLKNISTAKQAKVYVKYNEAKYATGYEIAFNSNKSCTKGTSVIIDNKNTVEFTMTEIKKNSKYYVRVRAFRNINGEIVYGPFSKISIVKT